MCSRAGALTVYVIGIVALFGICARAVTTWRPSEARRVAARVCVPLEGAGIVPHSGHELVAAREAIFNRAPRTAAVSPRRVPVVTLENDVRCSHF